MKKLVISTLLTIELLVQRVRADIPNDTGYHLFRDKIAVKAKRLFQIPLNDAGRHLLKTKETTDYANKVNHLAYGTWQKSNGRKSFPEVQRVYSYKRYETNQVPAGAFQRYYTWFKSDMGKYGWWQLSSDRNNRMIDPNTLMNNGNNGDDQGWNKVRARFDSLTGDCSHKMHYRFPYMIIICYNKNAIHNTHNHPMVYDYYIRVGQHGIGDNNVGNTDGRTWDISGQNLMNYSRWRGRIRDGGHGADNTNHGANADVRYNWGNRYVDFNHRVHVTTIWAARNREIDNDVRTDGGTWWTLTWNGPYEGQTSVGRNPAGVRDFTTNDGRTAAQQTVQGPRLQSGNVIFLRPHNDFAFLKTCAVPIAGLRVITDIVQPNGGGARIGANAVDSSRIYVSYIHTSGQHRLARCNINAGMLNVPPLASYQANPGSNEDAHILIKNIVNPPVNELDCLTGCADVPDFGTINTANTGLTSITAGGIKYVRGRGNSATSTANFGLGATGSGWIDYIVYVNDQTKTVSTCVFDRQNNRILRTGANNDVVTRCVSTPTCPEDPGKNNFGYFSECRDSASCGVYYMGRVGPSRPETPNKEINRQNNAISYQSGTGNVNSRFNLMNRVFCADILKFDSVSPLLYRRHFTANEVAAHDIWQTITSGVDSEANAMMIRSFQELYIYNSHVVTTNAQQLNPNANIAYSTYMEAVLKDRDVAPMGTNLGLNAEGNVGPYKIIGRVVRAIDPNKVLGSYHSIGYYNSSYALPYRRGDWKVNAPQIGVTNSLTNNSVLLLNKVHIDNTENWNFWDQIPLGHTNLRLRRGFDNTGNRHFEFGNCTIDYHNTVRLNCTYNRGTQNIQTARHAIGNNQHIKRVWWFDESIVVQTTRRIADYNPPLDAERAIPLETSHLYAYRKRDGTWSNLNWNNNWNSNTNAYAHVDGNDPSDQPDIWINGPNNNHNIARNRRPDDSTDNSNVIEFIDVAEHEGDLIVAFKRWSYAWITKPIEIRFGRGLSFANGNFHQSGTTTIPNYQWNPFDHRTGINRPGGATTNGGNTVSNENRRGPGWTNRRFFPLEDDSCITGFNIVTDISWKVRFLLDCNKVARRYHQRSRRAVPEQLSTNAVSAERPLNNVWGATKWIGDYWIFDNNWVSRYRNIWNVSLINSGAFNPVSGAFDNNPTTGALRNDVEIEDYFGKDFEYGCATKEYVFVYDPDPTRGWVVAAVHMHHHSIRFFELNTFGITSVQKLICVGDYVVGRGRTSQTANTGALFVLYGTNIEDARNRIHSIEKLPVLIDQINPTLVDDKIWIRCMSNGRPFHRVAFTNGPIVRLNSTNSQWTQNQRVAITNHAGNTVNHNLQSTFVWNNNIVNVTDIKPQASGASSYNLDSMATIKGHVYGAESYGINSQLQTIRQRVYFEKDYAGRRRRILQPIRNGANQHRIFDIRTYANAANADSTGNGWAQNDRFYEMKIKGDQMARLKYHRGYTQFNFYNNPETRRLQVNTGYECEKVAFDRNRGVATTAASYNYLYWATECQETHYRVVRIYRDFWGGANLANHQQLGTRIVHNDDIHKMTLDTIRDQRVLMTFYNQNEHILNMSVYDFSATNAFQAVVSNVAGVQNGWTTSSFHSDMVVPVSTHLQVNGKLPHNP